ncbi:MAG: addiction module protein [Rhodospirillaceae bacterium]|nr:addiction module protein [Rhodospirillaceae bacterium]
MTDAAKRLSIAARNLPPGDRLELVEQLLDSLDATDSATDAVWAKEAQDRLVAYRRGEIEAVSLASVLAKYKAHDDSAVEHRSS